LALPLNTPGGKKLKIQMSRSDRSITGTNG